MVCPECNTEVNVTWEQVCSACWYKRAKRLESENEALRKADLVDVGEFNILRFRLDYLCRSLGIGSEDVVRLGTSQMTEGAE